jgi:hypothetical protein
LDRLKNKNLDLKNIRRVIFWAEEWSRQYHEKSASKGKFFYEICPELLEKPWYAKCRLKNETIRTINRVFTSHTFTKDRLYIMRLSDDNSCDICGTMESIEHILYDCHKYVNVRIRTYCLDRRITLKEIFQRNLTYYMSQIRTFLDEIKIRA